MIFKGFKKCQREIIFLFLEMADLMKVQGKKLKKVKENEKKIRKTKR